MKKTAGKKRIIALTAVLGVLLLVLAAEAVLPAVSRRTDTAQTQDGGPKAGLLSVRNADSARKTGGSCTHAKWADGVCTECGYVCLHPEHDTDGICLTCGQKVYHSYTDGVCSCGREYNFALYELPSEIGYNAAATPEKGTLEYFSYTTRNYKWEAQSGTQGGTYEKRCLVYLPYGYSTDRSYDVLFLVHGGEGDESTWLNEPHTCRDYDVYFPYVLDSMIYHGACEPLIVVAFSTYLETDDGRVDMGEREQLTPEFRNDILPAVAERYSTYAADGSEAALQAARDHFGMAGNSNGAVYTLYTGVQDCVDLLSWFGCFSGNNGVEAVVKKLNTVPELPIHFFLATCGEWEYQYGNVFGFYYDLVNGVSGLTDNGNAAVRAILKSDHDYTTWGVSLYDALLVFFR